MEAVALIARLFDIVLGSGLLLLAWRLLTCSELFKAIVLFIVFGLLMAIAWVRMDAPDVALAVGYVVDDVFEHLDDSAAVGNPSRAAPCAERLAGLVRPEKP